MNPLASWLTLLIVISAGVGILWGVSLIFNSILDHIANAVSAATHRFISPSPHHPTEDDDAMRRGGNLEEKE